MKKYLMLIIITFMYVDFVFGQYNVKLDTVKPLIEESSFNGKPSVIKTYFNSIDKTKWFKIMQQGNKFYEFASDDNGVGARFSFYTNNKIMFYVEFKNKMANGNLIWFDKKGKIEMIARYDNSVLQSILYYRKASKLNEYLRIFGDSAPIIEGPIVETKGY